MTQLTLLDTSAIKSLQPAIAPETLTLASPALDAVLDFHQNDHWMIEPNTSAQVARAMLKREHAKFKIVAKNQTTFLGIVDWEQLAGPTLVKQIGMGYQQNELTVEDLMVKRSSLFAISYQEMLKANVSDLVSALSKESKKYGIVFNGEYGGIHGVICADDIARRLKLDLAQSGRAVILDAFEG